MNIYDIAKEAGVSIATVSRVLNGTGTVRPATRERVEAILRRHNYTPSAIARGMVSKSLRTVAVLTVDIRVPHYAHTAYTIEQEFSRRGYEVILCNTGGNEAAALNYLRAVTEKQVDGIILVGSVFGEIGKNPKIEAILKTVPVVLANGTLEIPNAHSVLVQDRLGVQLAVNHLLSRGKRKLAYVQDKKTASAREKAEGFRQAMHQFFPEQEPLILETEDTLAGAVAAAEKLLELPVMPDGIVCGEDLTAVGILKGLTRSGIRIPEQVAVTGFNHSVYGKLCLPELTSVDNKPEQVALSCVQLLERLMNGEPGSSISIAPELIEGDST